MNGKIKTDNLHKVQSGGCRGGEKETILWRRNSILVVCVTQHSITW